MVRKILKLQMWVLFAVILYHPVQAQDPNFHIYLCFGQSNMEGQGNIESQDQTVDSRCQNMQAVSCTGQPAEKWRTAKPPIARCNTKLGPSDYFGREMVANLPSNIKVGIVHVSIAGCKIELFDKNNYATYASSAESWMQSIIASYGGNPYGRLVDLAKIAQKDGVIKGILLHQGESNTGDQQWPNKVKGVYNNLLTDLNLTANNVPLLVGQVVDAEQGGICASMNSIINSLPNTIPTAHIISSSGCTDQSDNLHFSSAGYRLLGKRYAQMMLSLLQLGTINASFTTPANNSSLVSGAETQLKVTATDSKGQITSVAFYDGDNLISTDNSSPYTAAWSSTVLGVHKIRAVVTNSASEKLETTIDITVNIPQGPYGGTPHAIPGTIQFEEFDLGGNGNAYFDDSEGSETGSTFRSDQDVDIEACTDVNAGYNIGYSTAGEWLEYSINVAAAGTYNLKIRVACSGTGRTVNIALDGKTIADKVAIPNTAGWQTWQTVTVQNVSLQAGAQVMRVTIGDVDYVNLNYITFEAVNVSKPPVVSFTAPNNISSFTPGKKATIKVDATDPDGTVAKVELYKGDELLATDVTAPYSFEWTGTIPGTHTFTAIATDDKGISTTSTELILIIEAVAAPFNGTPHLIPGKIEIEEYDLGGEGLGYHEANTEGNEGNATFRNDGVDLENCDDIDGGFNLGYALTGEWLAYSVDVQDAGVYTINRFACCGKWRQ